MRPACGPYLPVTGIPFQNFFVYQDRRLKFGMHIVHKKWNTTIGTTTNGSQPMEANLRSQPGSPTWEPNLGAQPPRPFLKNAANAPTDNNDTSSDLSYRREYL